MHWYGGSIAEAVSLSKQKNAIFVVFVEGDNDLSQEMAQTIDSTVVVSRLSDQANFLAIKLKSGSPNYTHFAQIYQFVPVPSLFFIGRNGTPLEVVCAGVEASNLATRIDRILAEHRKEKSPLVQPSTSSQNLKEQTVNLLQSEAASSAPVKPEAVKVPEPRAKEPEVSEPAAKIPKTDSGEENKAEEYEVLCDGDVCVRRPKGTEGPGTSKQAEPVQMDTQPSPASTAVVPGVPAPVTPNNPAPGPSEAQVSPSGSVGDIEDKLERAKELIDARRREKAEKEKELEKEKEMERRAAGKGVAELKKWQADQELKQIQEERKREKLENNLARQRILEQIAQDRAERRARDAPPPAHPPAHPPAPAHAPAPAPATSGDGGTRARIQFKLPDGSSHTAHFDAHDTLGDVQRYIARYIADNLHLSASSFSLWTAFPRRELDAASSSLRELQLAPSAALLVLPRRAAAVVARPSAFANIIAFFTQLFTSLILEPSQQVYEWVRRRLFPAPPPQDPAPRPPPSPSPPPPPGGVRRRGNIHRLPGDRGGDDENNTWNGNSTQQM